MCRYRASHKAYQPQPPPWEYPSGSEVRTLRGNGCMSMSGQDYFVCLALVGQRVRLERFEDKILVSYRQMHIREIDLKTGRTTAVVRPVRRTEVLPMS